MPFISSIMDHKFIIHQNASTPKQIILTPQDIDHNSTFSRHSKSSMSQSKSLVSVTLEKEHPISSTAEFFSLITNNEPVLRNFQNWQINLNMKDNNLQILIIIILRWRLNIRNTMNHFQPLNMRIFWFKINDFSNI